MVNFSLIYPKKFGLLDHYCIIECRETSIRLNNNLSTSSLFYHFQQSLEGTNILCSALRHISEGLGCMEKEYKKEGTPPPPTPPKEKKV